MASTRTGEGTEPAVPGLALRFTLGAITVLAYLAVRGSLDPAPLVAARFGVGITLFALLIDIGRALAGAAAPMQGEARPHRQRAEPLVDDAYRNVHQAMERFLHDGRWSQRYETYLREAMSLRDIPEEEQTQAIEDARETATGPPYGHRPLTMALVSGLVAVVGLAAVVGVLLGNLGQLALQGPLTLLVGLGIYALQLRPMRTGHRWVTAGVGLLGAGLALVGTAQMSAQAQGPWGLLYLGAGALALGTVGIVVLADFTKPPWRQVRRELEDELVTLRRAFLAVLLAGLVLFPFQPLLEALFQALSWPLATPYRMAVIGYATAATFLALELASAWYALARGDSQARAHRQARVEANEHLLSLIESRSRATPRPTGGRR